MRLLTLAKLLSLNVRLSVHMVSCRARSAGRPPSCKGVPAALPPAARSRVSVALRRALSSSVLGSASALVPLHFRSASLRYPGKCLMPLMSFAEWSLHLDARLCVTDRLDSCGQAASIPRSLPLTPQAGMLISRERRLSHWVMTAAHDNPPEMRASAVSRGTPGAALPLHAAETRGSCSLRPSMSQMANLHQRLFHGRNDRHQNSIRHIRQQPLRAHHPSPHCRINLRRQQASARRRWGPAAAATSAC